MAHDISESFSLISCNKAHTVTSGNYTLAPTALDAFECDNSGLRVNTNSDFGSRTSTPLLESNLLDGIVESPYLTVSVWITPEPYNVKSKHKIQSILTIGTQSDSSEEQRGPCGGYDLSIIQMDGQLVVFYVNGDDTCQNLKTDYPLLPLLTQISVTFANQTATLEIDDNIVETQSGNDYFQNWDTSGLTLQLFSSHAVKSVFRGSIHRVDISGDDPYGNSNFMQLQNEPIIQAFGVNESANFLHQLEQNKTLSSLQLKIGSHNKNKDITSEILEILTLPRHGTLLMSGGALEKLDRIPLEKSTWMLEYQLTDPTYFNEPLPNKNGSPEFFQFRVLGFSNKNTLVASSNVVQQAIRVINRNHPPFLTMDESGNDVEWDLDTGEAQVQTAISVNDPEQNVYRVRVDVFVQEGVVSLADTSLADFECSNELLEDWECTGDGWLNSNMTFVAYPDDVPSILGNLTYFREEAPFYSTEIEVKVYDGAGGNCIVQSVGIHEDCFETTIVFPVSHLDNRSKLLRFVTIADMIFWGTLLFFVVICYVAGQMSRCVNEIRRLRNLKMIRSPRYYESDDMVMVSEDSFKRFPPSEAV